jgi:hypothetical protein
MVTRDDIDTLVGIGLVVGGTLATLFSRAFGTGHSGIAVFACATTCGVVYLWRTERYRPAVSAAMRMRSVPWFFGGFDLVVAWLFWLVYGYLVRDVPPVGDWPSLARSGALSAFALATNIPGVERDRWARVAVVTALTFTMLVPGDDGIFPTSSAAQVLVRVTLALALYALAGRVHRDRSPFRFGDDERRAWRVLHAVAVAPRYAWVLFSSTHAIPLVVVQLLLDLYRVFVADATDEDGLDLEAGKGPTLPTVAPTATTTTSASKTEPESSDDGGGSSSSSSSSATPTKKARHSSSSKPHKKATSSSGHGDKPTTTSGKRTAPRPSRSAT